MDVKINQTYKNAMEILVIKETEKQLKVYPPKAQDFINKIEVATYALNRLPSLYASSSEGFELQLRRGQKEFSKEIYLAVKQGFAAVQRDPLRASTPLIKEEEKEFQEVKRALQELTDIIPQRELGWLVKFVKEVLTKIANQEMTEYDMQELYYKLYYDWSDYYYEK